MSLIDRMHKFSITIFGLFLSFCTSVDFIPDSDFSQEYPEYSKKRWEEVEIYFQRPEKRIFIQGEIQIRDFADSGKIQDYLQSLKKEMFRKKIDGVWIQGGYQIHSIENPTFQTSDSRGNTTYSHNSESNLRIWKGIAFREKR